MYELENAPQMQKCPKTFAHDCSFLIPDVIITKLLQVQPIYKCSHCFRV